MKLFAVGVLALILSACASNQARWENRLVCTYDGKEAHYISKWWIFSIGTEIDKADAQIACKPDGLSNKKKDDK